MRANRSVVVAMVVNAFRGARRDRSALVFLLILPVALMLLMGNIYASEDAAVPRLAVWVDSPDPIGMAVLDVLREAGTVELVGADDRSALDDAVRRRRVDAGLLIAVDRPVTLVGAPDVQLPGGLRFVVSGALRRVSAASALTAAGVGSIEDTLAVLPEPPTVPVEDPAEARTEAAIGVLVLVTFMNMIAFAAMVPAHRSTGVFERLHLVPSGRRIVVAGYASTFVAVAAAQIATTVVAGRLLVGIDWGPLVPVVGIGAALAVAAGGVATMAGTLFPTPESGSTIGGPAGFALGMLGGCLWPLEFVGGPLESIGRWVPHQWAIAALRSAAAGTLSTWPLVVAVVSLVGFGLLCAGIGSRRLASSWG